MKETIVASDSSDIMLPAEADKFPVTSQLQKSGSVGPETSGTVGIQEDPTRVEGLR